MSVWDGSVRERPAADTAEAPPSADGPRPVPWVARLAPAVHGALGASSDAPRGLLDFSANGNVLGPSPAVAEAISRADVARYPDPDARALRRAIAAVDGVDERAVVVGNGSTELIWALARAYLAPGRRAVVLGPTYGEYAVASAATGAEVQTWAVLGPAHMGRGRLPTSDQGPLAAHLARCRPALVWLCHPNNPTGAPFPVECLHELMAAAPDALFAVDEAYLPLADGLRSALPLVASGRVALLRSLTKDAGLAGLRVGYALTTPTIADVLRRVIPPWSVNALAQAAAIAALGDRAHARRVRAAVACSRADLTSRLTRLGLRPYPSVANFLLVPVGDGHAVARALLKRGLAVRDCTSFGLPDCIRIGVRVISEQRVLVDALREVLAGTGAL